MDAVNKEINGTAKECVTIEYRSRTVEYQSLLSGEALEEARLSPVEHVRIQAALNALGLANQGEGKFGPSTREAIRTYQTSQGQPPTGFLTTQEMRSLVKPNPGFQTDRDRQNLDQANAILGGLFGIPIPKSAPSRFRPYAAPVDREGPPEAPQSPNSPATHSPDEDAKRFEGGSTSSFDPPKSVRADEVASTGVRTVEIVGTGNTPDEARNEATRLAIQKVAGLYVDARRKVETKITDEKVSDIVDEKIISYTNAYVKKIDIIETKKVGDIFQTRASVSVAIAPLLKVLQDNAVPVIDVDANSNAATAMSIAEEKQGAMDLYSDLIGRSASLVTVGVGKAEVDPSIPSSADAAWLSIPITYKLNEDSLKEWRAKFDMFAQHHQYIDVPVITSALNNYSKCTAPFFDRRFAGFGQGHMFLGERTANGDRGIAACFAGYSDGRSAHMECIGRKIYVPSKPEDFFRPCSTDAQCLLLRGKTRKIGMILRMLDKDGHEVVTSKIPFGAFPKINLAASSTAPIPDHDYFFNWCVPGQSAFFESAMHEEGYPYGDVLLFPEPGSRIRGYYNQLMSNDKIARIASISAAIVQDLSDGEVK